MHTLPSRSCLACKEEKQRLALAAKSKGPAVRQTCFSSIFGGGHQTAPTSPAAGGA